MTTFLLCMIVVMLGAILWGLRDIHDELVRRRPKTIKELQK